MRLADQLVRHASRIAPPERAEWAQAMQAEVAHITDPAQALAFAGGCAKAAYGQRLRSFTTLIQVAGRGVAVLMALYAYGLAWMSSKLVEAWTHRTGEQPAWPFIAMSLMALVFLAGAFAAFRRGPAVLTPFAVGAMAVNTATLVVILNTPTELTVIGRRALHERFYAAIVVEQYVILLLLLVAGLVLGWAPRSSWLRRLAMARGLHA